MLKIVLLKIAGSFLTERFFTKIIVDVSIEGLHYVKKKNLIKDSNVDELVIDNTIQVLESLRS